MPRGGPTCQTRSVVLLVLEIVSNLKRIICGLSVDRFALLVLSDIVEKKAPFVAEVAARKGKYELAMTACKVCTN